jgi:hypothetical protein
VLGRKEEAEDKQACTIALSLLVSIAYIAPGKKPLFFNNITNLHSLFRTSTI